MNLSFAEKVGIFLGTTTLTFALGIAACSPLAPSVAKNQLGTKNVHQGGDSSGVVPNPAPNGLHLLFHRGRNDASLFVGKDGFDWFFKSLSKNSQQFLFSAESFPMPLEDFKREGKAEIQVQPSNDWQPQPDGSFSGMVSLQLDLTNSAITPAQAENFAYDVKAPSANDVRRAIDRHATVSWSIEVKDSVDSNTRALFLGALDGIRLTINTKETPVTAVNPAPAPNHALEKQDAEDAAPQD